MKTRNRPLPPGLAPWEVFAAGTDLSDHDAPDIIEFVTSDHYLNRPNLYPRQATLLKAIFLQTELFTDYDYEVIEGWSQNFAKTADEKGQGTNGTQVDLLDRIEINRRCPCGHDLSHHSGIGKRCQVYDDGEPCSCSTYQGRRWFRECICVIGRRGSKGHIGALAGSYVLWHYLCKGDPQGYYGIDRDKRLSMTVFAGKKEQALREQWRDINNLIVGAPCFSPYISRAQTQSLTLFSRWDFVNLAERASRGVYSEVDPATFEILPRESTVMSGRGPAMFSQYYDEMAHIVRGVAKVDAKEVYDSATPALDQFGADGFIYEGSSPWAQTGQFYENYLKAIEVEEDGKPVYPEVFMVQLTSWDLYADWEMAHQLHMWPDGMRFPRFKRAIQTYDHNMQQLERANPETFAVERRSRWAASLNTYLSEDVIAAIWQPWPTDERPMVTQQRGRLDLTYRAHGDPSQSGANFGYAIAHLEGPDERGFHHVIFDVIHAWLPSDYDDHRIDYDDIEVDLKDYLDRFMPAEQTFDQYPMGSTLSHLRSHIRKRNYPKRVVVYERTATRPLNWKTYETFKTALGLGLVHGPYHELADGELTFLEDRGGKVEPPTAGPVQTKDVADCLAIVTYELVGHEIAAFVGKALGELQIRGGNPGGAPPFGNEQDPSHEALSNFGRSRGVRPEFRSFGKRRR